MDWHPIQFVALAQTLVDLFAGRRAEPWKDYEASSSSSRVLPGRRLNREREISLFAGESEHAQPEGRESGSLGRTRLRAMPSVGDGKEHFPLSAYLSDDGRRFFAQAQTIPPRPSSVSLVRRAMLTMLLCFFFCLRMAHAPFALSMTRSAGLKPAANPAAGKPQTKNAPSATNKLLEKRPRNFGIGQDIQPKRDLTRFVKWPEYVRLQRQRVILSQRLKIPPAIAQFENTLDKNTATQLFRLLNKYRPETKQEKKARLGAIAADVESGKKKDTADGKKPIFVKSGLNHTVALIEAKKAQLVIIANDVDPIELVVFVPALCRKMGIPYVIVKNKARLGQVVHRKTSAVLAISDVKSEDSSELSKLVQAAKANYLDKYEETRKHWGGSKRGNKSIAKLSKRAKASGQSAATVSRTFFASESPAGGMQVQVTFDDNSFAFTYSGNWTVPDTSARGFPFANETLNGLALTDLIDGTYHASSTPGDYAVFNYTGSAGSLYTVSGPGQGSYSLTSRGDTTDGNDTAASASIVSAPLGSSESVQIITSSQINNTGTSLVIDGLTFSAIAGAQGSTLTNTTIEDDSALLTYSGSWSSNSDTRFSGNTSTFTSGQGASVTARFNGSTVYAFGDVVDDHGLYGVTLDGGDMGQYDAYNPFLRINRLKFFAAGLNASQHTLVFTNLGSGTFFDLDRIVYTTPSTYYTVTQSPTVGNTTSSAGVPGSTSGSMATSNAVKTTRSVKKAAMLTLVCTVLVLLL
ncbi:uncharacterized protein L969DRAFT_92071 [Mixia osmundae IAM 14324]|uniref:uncharacterized protein n=1 Tax=Mixia osmundae (strain CBS 9802 / IAM 14324 / JCM 22182 / KY 12970) TaxID=764103 RepID=UPI0004A551B7|nr:uncharacterized protein L969DRAFT_92071 [Mixia osmundae IAM 14324]KEI42637.1 hypothetical protein L969DRAFT_92071 [Mixia osmundae IAM 14324]